VRNRVHIQGRKRVKERIWLEELTAFTLYGKFIYLMWQFSDFNLSFLHHLVSHRLNHFVQLATKTFVPAKAMLPPLPEVMGGLLEEIPCAEIIPPASPFENPARLAVLGENVYALAIAQVLLQYMSPQRLAAPAMRVSEFVPDAHQY
jgi:hypothetical protein